MTLERKIATYALAGGAALLAADDVGATIIYSDPPDITIDNATVGLDLDGGGDDFTITHTSGKAAKFQAQLDLTAGVENEYAHSVVFVAALDAGVAIPGSLSLSGGGPKAMADESEGTGGPWAGVSNKYLGLQLGSGPSARYGWARLSVNPVSADSVDGGLEATLHDFAYNDEAGASIAAGQIPEPGSLALLALGASGLATWFGRHRPANGNADEAHGG